jgi:hypothetical protein
MRYQNRDNWETQTHRTSFMRGDYCVIFQESSNITSYCGRTFPSWSHDVTLRHWACFQAQKLSPVPPKVHRDPFHVTQVLCTSMYVTKQPKHTPIVDCSLLVTVHFRFKSSYCNKMAGPAGPSMGTKRWLCYFKALQGKKAIRSSLPSTSKIIGAFRFSYTIEPD